MSDHFGAALRQWRKRRGISQLKLAVRAELKLEAFLPADEPTALPLGVLAGNAKAATGATKDGWATEQQAGGHEGTVFAQWLPAAAPQGVR